MSYSAEESSPIEYFESCCICDEEFSSDSELANHLMDHASDEEFKSALQELEVKSSARSSGLSRNATPEFTKTNSVREQSLKRSIPQRSKSPEVWEIISDDSGDESNKKKAPNLSNSFRLVSTPGSAPQSNVLQANIPQSNTPQPNAPAENGPPYNCQACKLVFNDIKLYREHVLTHDKARPYSCQICNKKFAYKGTLRQHLHLHIGEKSHECKICHKKFSMKRMLRQHEETHELQHLQRRGSNSLN